jgi:hypothetical protein
MNDNDQLIRHPEEIPGYTYGSELAARSPLTLEELDELKQAAGLTSEDELALREAAQILAGQADEMVSAWRAEIAEHPHLARYSAHPDGTPNPEYSAASKPRFDRWIIDACTRPLDQDWLDYQHEIGLRHTRARKNLTDDADAPDHIPLRYLLAFTAVVLTTSRDFIARRVADAKVVDRLHAAFTKSVMLHVTVWSRAYGVGRAQLAEFGAQRHRVILA